jgi:hypothetical protein
MTNSLLEALRERVRVEDNEWRVTVKVNARSAARLLFWLLVAVAVLQLAARDALVDELLKALAISLILKLRGSANA